MREPKRSSESLAVASALHQALMNHCRNSETDVWFWSTLSKCPRRSDSNALTITFLSPAELRSLFDRLGFAQLAVDNEYTCCLKDAYQVQLRSEPPGILVTSIVLGFQDAEGTTRFMAHAFIRTDGSLAGSGLCDPKFIFDSHRHCFKTR